MESSALIDKYFGFIQENHLFSSVDNLKYYLNYLFKRIDFKEKKVLDLGGGSGLLSFYAGCMGAKEVICIEPEEKGSTKNVLNIFSKFQEALSLGQIVRLEKSTFQKVSLRDKVFDIILLHNSVNHLDENACINLKWSLDARRTYARIFKKLKEISYPGAKLLISDCSRYNFFALLRLKNPFSPSIEWHKHQSPSFWANMLSHYGFSKAEIKWTSFNRLRTVGQIFLGNKVAAFFLHSHFCLIMEKSRNE